MKVVCALDSFKGSLGSRAAGEAARAGVVRAFRSATVEVLSIADGGEGTLDAIMAVSGHEWMDVETTNALHEPIVASYGIIDRNGRTAGMLECARAVGIEGLQIDATVPRRGSSYGFGRMLLDALDHDADELLITLGGSATTDGGTGLFQALGAVLLDDDGDEIPDNINPLWTFASIDVSGMRDLSTTAITVLSDVTNPLVGLTGAAAIFGPQKGATHEQVAHLDSQLEKWGRALERAFGREVVHVPGAGAAGGLGVALLALGAAIEPGFARVAQEIGLSKALKGADLVITGEGSLDAQSAFGKVPAGVARLAREAGAIVVGIAGRVQQPLGEMDELLDGAFAIHSELLPLEEAMRPEVTTEAITRTAYEVACLVRDGTLLPSHR